MTWLLRGLAFLLLLAAIAAAVVGYRLSTQPPPQPPAPPTENAIQSVRPLRAGVPVVAEDVAIRPIQSKPAGAFSVPVQVVGQIPITDIPSGLTLTRGHFPVEGQLLRSLRAGERAVAIKVDEVTGLGGFARPGDRVDVLLFLRAGQETGNTTLAEVVLTNARLLAYGEVLQQSPGDFEEGTTGVAASASRRSEKQPERPRNHSSAVLAVPEAAASRLMLAANSGILRLALRPAESAGVVGSDPYLVRLADLGPAARPVAPKADRPVSVPQLPSIVIHEGDAIRNVGVPSR